MTECNIGVIAQARINVAERYVQTYHINAIMAGDWDGGCLIRNEVERLLKHPPLVESEDQNEINPE